jgi:hypothetical protein
MWNKYHIYITSELSIAARMCYIDYYIIYSRALIFIPEVNTFEGIRAYNVGTGFVRWTVPFQIACHGGLSPLGSIHCRREGQVLPFQSYIIQTA